MDGRYHHRPQPEDRKRQVLRARPGTGDRPLSGASHAPCFRGAAALSFLRPAVIMEASMHKRLTALWIAASSVVLFNSCTKTESALTAGPAFQKKFQEALITAKPGAVIELPEGRLNLDRSLSLSVDNVTIRGKGIDKTILSFKNQKTGPAGMQVTSNAFTIED